MARFKRLNSLGVEAEKPVISQQKQSDTTQVVEVQFPGNSKRYSYVGSGNLRTNQKPPKPVTHATSGINYMTPAGKIVATHNVIGVNVGDNTAVSGGAVHKSPKPLKYLPGIRETQQDRQITAGGLNENVNEYLKPFKRLNHLGEVQ